MPADDRGGGYDDHHEKSRDDGEERDGGVEEERWWRRSAKSGRPVGGLGRLDAAGLGRSDRHDERARLGDHPVGRGLAGTE